MSIIQYIVKGVSKYTTTPSTLLTTQDMYLGQEIIDITIKHTLYLKGWSTFHKLKKKLLHAILRSPLYKGHLLVPTSALFGA